ncbi:hypothetical protein JKP88DRAFT_255964 [Tribonema minus]|uniref:Uncharacterized protein n=1 Tax=Tribonema minus TaxID=303371 RepID=A0A835YYE2_9STRA|nr:hypothetical protein JKP88DRAFT_255964 [Tribonema minus]
MESARIPVQDTPLALRQDAETEPHHIGLCAWLLPQRYDKSRFVTTELCSTPDMYTDEQLMKAAAYCILHQHIDTLQQILQSHPRLCLSRVTGAREDTLLHLAVLDDHSDVVNVILAVEPTTLESVNSQGQTPLQLACNVFSLKCAHVLLEWGADIEREDAQGATPVCIASMAVKDKCIEKWQFATLLTTLRRFEVDEFKAITVDGIDLSILRLIARANRHNLIRTALDVFPSLWNIINIKGADDRSLIEDCSTSESTLRYLISGGAHQDLVKQLHDETECQRVKKRAREAMAAADSEYEM